MRKPKHSVASSSDEDKNQVPEQGTTTKSRPKTKKPSMFRVLILNDDYTPMEFVVFILMGIFFKNTRRSNENNA